MDRVGTETEKAVTVPVDKRAATEKPATVGQATTRVGLIPLGFGLLRRLRFAGFLLNYGDNGIQGVIQDITFGIQLVRRSVQLFPHHLSF